MPDQAVSIWCLNRERLCFRAIAYRIRRSDQRHSAWLSTRPACHSAALIGL